MAAKKEVIDLVKECWGSANQDNKDLMEEFINNSKQLSDQTLKQYYSALKIYICFLKKFCKNVHFTEVKSRDLMKFQNWLYDIKIYESNIKLKRSAISSLNEYIILVYEDVYPTFRNFVTKGVKVPETGKKFIKEPLTIEEYEKLCKYLEEKEEWQKLAYIKFSYSSAGRRNEARQLLKTVVNNKPIEKNIKIRDENGVEQTVSVKKYNSNLIKCKGRKSAPLRKLSFDEDTMYYLKKWLEVRGEDDCEYMFITKQGEKAKQVGENTFNEWLEVLEDNVIGRRFYPHLLRSMRSSHLASAGIPISAIQKLLGHASSTTTQIYIVKNDKDEDDEDEIFT